MDVATIHQVLAATATAARLAREAGFKIIELHAAHGYLVHQFLSPIVNSRPDGYGGPLIDRARFLMEMLDAIRSEWPMDLPLFVRLSCTDWIAGGWTLEDTIELARHLKARGDVGISSIVRAAGSRRTSRSPFIPATRCRSPARYESDRASRRRRSG